MEAGLIILQDLMLKTARVQTIKTTTTKRMQYRQLRRWNRRL